MISEDALVETQSFKVNRKLLARIYSIFTLRILGPLLAPVILLGPLVIFLYWTNQILRNVSIAIVTIPLGLTILYFFLIRRSILGKENDDILNASQVYIFTESHIRTLVGDAVDNTFSWDVITRILRIEGWTLICRRFTVCVAVPHTAFETIEDSQTFDALIDRKAMLLKSKR